MAQQVEILLVEDNPYDAELSMRAFRQNNIANNIVHVEDGEEALDFLFARGAWVNSHALNIPRLILLDLKLPKVNGLEVLKIIKSDPRLKLVPVVVLTTSSQERDLLESYQFGVNSYLVKPVAFDKFIEVVRDIGMYWLILNQHPQK